MNEVVYFFLGMPVGSLVGTVISMHLSEKRYREYEDRIEYYRKQLQEKNDFIMRNGIHEHDGLKRVPVAREPSDYVYRKNKHRVDC